MSLVFNPFTGNFDFIGAGSIWSKVSDTISASSTDVVDSVANASFRSLKYIITAYNDANTVYETLEFVVLNANGTYKDTVSNKIKDGLNLSINSVNNAGTFELQVTNNELFTINIQLAKLVLT